jgi:hypothetical protein
MNSSPFELNLFDSISYFNIQTNSTGTNVVVRMIFLQDDSVDTATNVYFDNNEADGFAHVEWVGAYTDPATGQPSSLYLYLDDDYELGSSTNLLSYGDPGTGVPANYTIYTTTTQRSLGAPATNGFVSGLLSSGTVTNNIYSYVDAQLIPTTVSTSGKTGTIALTNLPGRVVLTAAKDLSLTLASVSGMNYLQLNSTNQFDYDGQSEFGSPYSDIYLGSTNGSMTITNLIQSTLPIWSGNLQAWNTRWFNSVTNSGTNIINYDFRVLLVSSQLNPTTSSQEQDFILYSSNNVVISDVLNITRNFSLNCTNLLLTTNGIGNGAASPQGEIDLLSSNIFWAAAVPRLRCLTNNGIISALNLAVYGSAASPYLALVNSGSITNSGGSTIYSADFENYGYFSAGIGSFAIQSQATAITNGTMLAGGSFSDTATNLVIGGTTLQAGKSITLIATNLLTDNGVTNGSTWLLGTNYVGIGSGSGLILPVKPAFGDLLGTTITNVAVSGTLLNDTWAGQDRGVSVAGYSNNVAIGQLVLDAQGSSPRTGFYFTGTGTSNAIYVDCLQLLDYASYTNRNGTNLPALSFNTNVVIYYAQALVAGGVSVAEKINHFNGDHLRWVPSYAGTFSSVAIVYPNGTTNVFNAALAASADIDSNGDGNPNSSDPTPFLVPSQLDFTGTVTNLPPRSVRLQWLTVANGTNFIYYSTNLDSPGWLLLTNFNSPMPYPSAPANVSVFDALTNSPRFYRVVVQPWLTYPY